MRNENSMKNLGDTELALIAREGDGHAFEEIYDRHVHGIARALASFAAANRDTLNDLVQETFCRVIDGLASYVPARPFSHWLYTIALNVGRNHARRRSIVSFRDPGELEAVSAGSGTMHELSDEVLAAAIFRFVGQLPGHQRDVVSLRVGSGMKYAEIGEMLGIPEGTVRRRMHDAIGVLREKLGVRISKEGRR